MSGTSPDGGARLPDNSFGMRVDAAAIKRLFSVEVSARVATAQDYEATLFPEEAAVVAKAVEKRRREFAAGRACARAALEVLGAPAGALPQRLDRAPTWPEGFVGSLTHCVGFCGAVAARASDARSVGFDVEEAGQLSPDLASLVCRPDELSRLSGRADPVGTNWPKLVFSAKEAFYKCYHPVALTWLGFEEASIWFGEGCRGDEGRFRIVIETREKAANGLFGTCEGRWRVVGGRIYTGVTLRASSPTQLDPAA